MTDLWALANKQKHVHTFSTLFAADRFDRYLGDDQGLDAAIDWCRQTGVTKVYLENFRTGRSVERAALQRAKQRFEDAGITTAGGITPTRLGKDSTGWDIVCCYTDPSTQDRLQAVCEEAAALFDLVMIDDFLFTDCQCEACASARGKRSWSEYRRALMTRLSRERILEPARRVNPDVKFIIKFPQWYDQLHERGYDVAQQTRDFDMIWAGTELRDPDRTRGNLPVVPQYEGFFMMRWLIAVGNGKCGGGWYDALATSPPNYIEQAWQTILGGAAESMLFAHDSLTDTERGRADAAALRQVMPQLFQLAELVQGLPVHGITCAKPPSSPAGDGRLIYDHVGMLGLPLAPAALLDVTAPAAFVSAESLHEPDIAEKVNRMLGDSKPVLATDGFLNSEPGIDQDAPGLTRLDVKGNPRALLDMPVAMLADVRRRLGEAVGLTLEAPTRVAINLFGDRFVAVSNFNDRPAEVRLGVADRAIHTMALSLPQRASLKPAATGHPADLTVPPRSLAVLELD